MQKMRPLLPALILCTIAQLANAETFVVALPFLNRVNPISNKVNLARYLSFHLYYPLFEIGPDGTLNSQFLNVNTSKVIDRSFKLYQVCLKENIHFHDASPIKTEDLAASITYMAEIHPHLIPLSKIKSTSDRCSQLEMKYPTPGLFKRLTGTASTIVKRSQVRGELPVGLGPYRITSMSDSKISLNYVGAHKVRFSQIDFTKESSVDAQALTAAHDTNQISDDGRQRISLKTKTMYDVWIPKNYSFVVNLKHRKDRLCAASKMAKIDWIKAYRLEVSPSANFLPWTRQVPTKPEVISSDCQRKVFRLIVPELYDAKSIRSAVISAGAEKHFQIAGVSNDEFGRIIFSGEEYIGLIGFDSASATADLEGDFSIAFEPFFLTKNRIVTTPNKNVRNYVLQALRSQTTPEVRLGLFAKAEVDLILNGFVFAVGKKKNRFSFPRGISIEKWFDRINGIPDISAIQ